MTSTPHAVGHAVDRAIEVLGPLAELDVSLAPLTTYRVGGAAAIFVRPTSIDHVHMIHRAAEASGLPILVVGRGSNLLVADEGYTCIALTLSALCADIHIHTDRSQVVAGAAVALPVLARRTVAAGLTGLEWAVGVPGSVGGGVRMNAGGHGSDMAATLVEVDLFDLRRGERATVPGTALGLRFRSSDLADHQVVLSATMQLRPGDPKRSSAELDDVVRWRRERQPGGQNAGSVFVNPVPGEVTAGGLIDSIGLRGLRIGSAEVSSKHANFVQADEGGRAADVVAVIHEVRRRVLAETGYLLRSEVRLVGFGDGDGDGEHRADDAGVIW